MTSQPSETPAASSAPNKEAARRRNTRRLILAEQELRLMSALVLLIGFGLFLALPILGTNALFERKGFKYIAVNAGYWILTIALMGGLLCAWQ